MEFKLTAATNKLQLETWWPEMSSDKPVPATWDQMHKHYLHTKTMHTHI